MTTLAKGYARAYQSQSVLTASPGQLVLMLYDGALRFMDHARDALESSEETPKRIERINTNLIKAQDILAELQASLNFEAGDYAKNLDRLYDYYQRRLFEANLKKKVAPVIEVQGLVRQLRDGWAEMLRGQGAQVHDQRGVA
ncbi:MAG TPA: flagellar export chaperone FliS [Opitutaceae bacterium]|nr:flagellar export chaperone FliS [Opitutaceae bacterium]